MQKQAMPTNAPSGALHLQTLLVGSAMLLMLAAARMPAAQLGFDAPRTTIRLADPFAVTVIAQFEQNEPSTWESGATPAMSILAGWPAGIQVLSCIWNTAAWQFDQCQWEQSEDNAAVWARGRARDPRMLTGVVAIATLICIARETDDDTFYFEVDPDPDAGSSMTIIHGGEIVDILGDPDDDYDGGDEVALTIANTPGYILSLTPASSIIPLAATSVAVVVAIRPASQAAAYDHVRVELEYDPSVFALTDLAALRASLPPFISACEIHCPASCAVPAPQPGCVIIADRANGELIVTMWCAPTNFAGALFAWQLLPQNIEDNSELAITFNDQTLFSAVERYGVDLLGMADDAEDGVESTEITVRHVDGLRLFLEPATPYGLVGSTTFARVMLAKSLAAPVQLDYFELELFFDPALIACGSNAFRINPALAVSGMHQTVSFATNTFLPDPERPDSLWYPWTAMAARIQVDLPAGLLLTQDVLCVGTLAFTPMTTGTVGFVRGDIFVEFDLNDIHDERACGSDWPFVLSAINDSSTHRSVTMALARDGDNIPVKPGERVSYTITSHGDALVNATYDLCWIFDDAGLALQTGAGIIVEPLVINATTTTIFRIHGTASTAATTCLARIQFTALKPGTMVFTPVSYALSTSEYCRVIEAGIDVLGAPGVPGDGVYGTSLTVADPGLIGLAFEPQHSLFAGVETPIALTLNNPHHTYWDALAARILIDGDSAILPARSWNAQLQNVQPLAFDNTITLVTNAVNAYYDATLALQLTATTGASVIATLPLLPTMDEVFWTYDTATNARGQAATAVRYGDMSVLDENGIDNVDASKWVVFPHGACVWLSDSMLPPVLGSNYTLTVRVDNPHGLALQRVTFAYAFDAAAMTVSQPVLLPGFSTGTGGVWISNNTMDGYLCGDIWCDTVTTARDVAILQVTIRPQLNQTLELLPTSMFIGNAREIGMGLWTAQRFNALELFDAFPENLCPAWHRGVVWLDMPQLAMDDQDLQAFESLVLDLGDILQNGSTSKTYRWWIEGPQDHVNAVFSLPNQTLTLSSLDNWSGSVQFRLCCQELGSPYVGEVRFSVNVAGDDPGDQLAIQLPRDEFITAIGTAFEQCSFSIANATGAVLVTADITGPDNQCHSILVRNAASGLVGEVLDIRGNGSVVWNTHAYAPGYYRGRIRVRYSPGTPVIETLFFVDLFSPGQDDDGDTYFLLYKSPAGRQVFTGRAVTIQNGTDRDSLTMVVRRGPAGDGLVALDSIVSDSGMQRMNLKGAVNIVTLNGPLGALAMEGGSIGQLTVTRGGIGTILIRTRWLNADGAFAENVGIVRGIAAEGSIKTIMVVGGAIGSADTPALIRSASGSIGSISTALKQRTYASDGDREIVASCEDGANLFATIEAPRGSIGKLFAKGGSIGTPYDYPLCTLRAAGDIKIVRAMADVYDGTPLGGSLFAAIDAGGAVGGLDAIGGDITRSEITDPDDISDSAHLPVRIAARSIKSLKALLRLSNYDGSKIAYGGSVHAVLDVQYGIDTITAVGGHACLLTSAAQAPSRIKSLLIRRATYKEYPDDEEKTLRGGDLIASAISTANNRIYKSSSPSDYHGPLLKLDVDGAIRDSWIGFASKPNARTLLSTTFRYGSLENSEFWEAYNGRIYVNGK